MLLKMMLRLAAFFRQTIQMTSSCFCDITQRPVAGSYRSFGIAYWQLNNTLRCVTSQKSKGSSSTEVEARYHART